MEWKKGEDIKLHILNPLQYLFIYFKVVRDLFEFTICRLNNIILVKSLEVNLLISPDFLIKRFKVQIRLPQLQFIFIIKYKKKINIVLLLLPKIEVDTIYTLNI